MPISLEWNPHTEVFTMTTAEQFTLDELAELIARPEFAKGRRFLWDLRELKAGPDTTTDMRRASGLIDAAAISWSGMHLAVVVAREVDFGVARMFSVYAEGTGIEFGVFRDMDVAVGWLRGMPNNANHV